MKKSRAGKRSSFFLLFWSPTDMPNTLAQLWQNTFHHGLTLWRHRGNLGGCEWVPIMNHILPASPFLCFLEL
jgi:hypothetical protein